MPRYKLSGTKKKEERQEKIKQRKENAIEGEWRIKEEKKREITEAEVSVTDSKIHKGDNCVRGQRGCGVGGLRGRRCGVRLRIQYGHKYTLKGRKRSAVCVG